MRSGGRQTAPVEDVRPDSRRDCLQPEVHRLKVSPVISPVLCLFTSCLKCSSAIFESALNRICREGASLVTGFQGRLFVDGDLALSFITRPPPPYPVFMKATRLPTKASLNFLSSSSWGSVSCPI